jgi:hypothetical protein
LTLLDVYVLALPIIGVIFMLAVDRYGSRELRAETERVREAERKAQQQPHAMR